jgi:dienelactone hydrolase
VEGRGDLYASTTLRIRPMNFAALAADDVALARWHAEEGMRLWTPDGYHAQHYYHLVALTNADLYDGKPRAAWQRLVEHWKALARSLFLRVQVVRIEATCMRGRAALAAAADDPSLLREAAAAAARLDKERTSWATALARLLRAGIAAREKRDALVEQHLAAAAELFAQEKMQLFAAVARRRSDPAADVWMASQRIRNPERLSAVLAPGVF